MIRAKFSSQLIVITDFFGFFPRTNDAGDLSGIVAIPHSTFSSQMMTADTTPVSATSRQAC